MPRRDGTGPMGRGAMTGRGFGPCAGYQDNYYGAGAGYGYGRGRGRGYGRRAGWYPGFAPSNVDSLAEEKEFLQRRLADIEKQMEENS